MDAIETAPAKYIVIVDPPSPESVSQYILVLNRPGPFSPPLIIAVDALREVLLEEGVLGYEAWGGTPSRLLVRFPPSYDYILISRELTKFVPKAEFVAAQEREMHEEHKRHEALHQDPTEVPEPKGYL